MMMDMDRGPWQSPLDYISAVALREISYISSYARALPQSSPLQIQGQIGDPAVHIRTLNHYLSLAPYLIPSKDSFLSAFCLWHPDLNGSNLFVSESVDQDGLSSYDISDVIDWQHALIAPMYLQARMPSIIRQVGPKEGTINAPSNVTSLRRRLDTLSQKELDILTRQALLHAYSANSLSVTLASTSHLKTVVDPFHLVSSATDTLRSESLPPFRSALDAVINNWDGIWTELHGGNAPPCPVQPDSDLLGALQDKHQIWADGRKFLNNIVEQVVAASHKQEFGEAERKGVVLAHE